jgi:hypothetical protein
LVKPACLSALGIAAIGPMPITSGRAHGNGRKLTRRATVKAVILDRLLGGQPAPRRHHPNLRTVAAVTLPPTAVAEHGFSLGGLPAMNQREGLRRLRPSILQADRVAAKSGRWDTTFIRKSRS